MTTGKGPLWADGALPAGGPVIGAADAAPPEGRDDSALAGDGRQRQGKNRKRRRGKRRPVYAPRPAPAHSAATAVDAAPAVNGADIAPPVDRKPVGEERRRTTAAPLYGALDLGTNNCRLLVAVPRDRGFRVIDAYSRIVRLGEGMGRTGRLSEPAMTRAVEALGSCRAKLDARQVARTRMIATEACRLAENGAEFVSRVERETGIALEIVSQKTEARLAVAGCASLVDPHASGVILFDIGGGSTELVWIDLAGRIRARRRISDSIRSWRSLPVGVVTLSEHFGGEHVSSATFEAMVAEVDALLADFPDAAALDAAFAAGGVHMLGTSGTVTTLAGVHLGLPRYDRNRVDGLWMTADEVDVTTSRLVAMDYEARVAHPCIGRERADLVVAGCAILEAFRRRWPCDRLRVADRGLREGMLVEMMAADGVWRRRPVDDGQAPGRRIQGSPHA